MHISSLETRAFRNLRDLSIDLEPGVVVVQGDNGQGKTNLLEALYVCATGKSFRTHRAGEMIVHEGEQASAKAKLYREEVAHFVGVDLYPRRKVIRVDDRVIRGTSELLDLINVVAFFPDDLRVIKGSPEERRRFLDRAAANAVPGFVDNAARYTKALKSRNSVLKQAKDQGRRPDRTLAEVYEAELIESGALLLEQRAETLAALMPHASARFSALMPGLELSAALICFDEHRFGEEDPKNLLERSLQASWGRDCARGVTSVGPHRGDVEVSIGGRRAADFASQGQQRSAILSLKLAELAFTAERVGATPVLLLDDVSSELDARRREALFEHVFGLDSQVWVSTTGATDLPVSGAQRFLMEAGQVSAL